MHPIAILNTTVLTADGRYELQAISLDEARGLVAAHDVRSAVSHEATAEILTELLGVPVPVRGDRFIQVPGQRALVFKLRGMARVGQELTRAEIEEMGVRPKDPGPAR